MYTNAKAKGNFCQVNKKGHRLSAKGGRGTVKTTGAPPPCSATDIQLGCWAAIFTASRVSGVTGDQDCLFGNLALPDSIIIFIPSGVSGVTGDTGYRVTRLVSDIAVLLFYIFTFFSSSYIYMKYWASFTVCLLVPSERQKAHVRQQKDRNVNTCVVLFFHVPRAVLARGSTVTAPLLSTSSSS